MYCKNCGAYLPDDAQICTVCDAAAQTPSAQQRKETPLQPESQPQESQQPQAALPQESQPQGEMPRTAYQQPAHKAPAYWQPDFMDGGHSMKMSEWVVVKLLMFVPIVNVVMLFLWAFGKGHKESKRNWARVELIFVGAGMILYTLLIAIIVVMVLSEPGYLMY